MTVVEGQGTEEVSGPALYIERRLRLGEERVVVLVEARQNVHRGVVQLAVVVGGRLPVVGVVITPEASVIVTWEGDLVIKPAPDRDLYSHIRHYTTCCSLSKTDPFRQKYRKYSFYSFRILRKKFEFRLYYCFIVFRLYSFKECTGYLHSSRRMQTEEEERLSRGLRSHHQSSAFLRY